MENGLLSRAFVGASQGRAQTRQQFTGVEWLGDVVIGPTVEGFNFFRLAVLHSENDDGDLGPLTQTFKRFEAGDVGQSQVKNDRIETFLRGQGDSLLSIGGERDAVAGR